MRYRIPPRTRVISGSSEYVAVLVRFHTGIECCRQRRQCGRALLGQIPRGTDRHNDPGDRVKNRRREPSQPLISQSSCVQRRAKTRANVGDLHDTIALVSISQ